MVFGTRKKHVIDIIFPIALLFVFALTSLIVILLSANVYSRITRSSSISFDTQTTLSYLSEKIHQNDENGTISLGSFNGQDALVIHQLYGEEYYNTYIYEYEGSLRELFIRHDSTAPASAGKEIAPIKDFQIEEPAPGLFRFSCLSSDARQLTTIVAAKSGGGLT